MTPDQLIRFQAEEIALLKAKLKRTENELAVLRFKIAMEARDRVRKERIQASKARATIKKTSNKPK